MSIKFAVLLLALLVKNSPPPVVHSLHTVQTIANNDVAGSRPLDTGTSDSVCNVDILEASFYHHITGEVVQCKLICPPRESKSSDLHRSFCRDNCRAYYDCVVEAVADQCTNAEMNQCLSQCFDAAVDSLTNGWPISGDLSTHCRVDGDCSEAVLCVLQHARWKISNSRFSTAELLTTSYENVTKLQQAEPATDNEKAGTRTPDVSAKRNSTQSRGTSTVVAVASAIAAFIAVFTVITIFVRQGCVKKELEPLREQNREEDLESSRISPERTGESSTSLSSNVDDVINGLITRLSVDAAAKSRLKTVEKCRHGRERDVEVATRSMSVHLPTVTIISLRSDDQPPIQCSEENYRITITHDENFPDDTSPKEIMMSVKHST